MSAAIPIENRVAALERQVSRIESLLNNRSGDWMQRVIGSFADRPEFDEVLRLGREFRKSQSDIDDIEDCK